MSGGPDPSPDRPIAAETGRADLVHNEQTKLRATLLNTVSAGFIVAGIVTPTVAAFRGGAPPSRGALVLTVVWFVLACALHIPAVLTLEGLR